jgi:hypothetical protein
MSGPANWLCHPRSFLMMSALGIWDREAARFSFLIDS